ncbi:MAG: hypothetical protein ACI8V0_001334 [Pseudohongiellaceae bacterium]
MPLPNGKLPSRKLAKHTRPTQKWKSTPLFQLEPVQLIILVSAKVTIATAMLERDVHEHARLNRCQHTVRQSDTQHGGKDFDVCAVPQTQLTQFIFRQFI